MCLGGGGVLSFWPDLPLSVPVFWGHVVSRCTEERMLAESSPGHVIIVFLDIFFLHLVFLKLII